MAYINFRQIARHCFHNKAYSLICIGGLALSLTVVLLIYSFVIKEIQIDRFHKNSNNIYRVLTQNSPTDKLTSMTCEPLAPEAQSRIPGIKSYARIHLTDLSVKVSQAEYSGKLEHCINSDASFFTLFTFPLTNGTINAESPKDWAVISQSAASRYFGNENPIGQTIAMQNSRIWEFSTPQEYQIVAVMKDFPDCSTLQADFILDYQKIAGFSDWQNNYMLYTYLQLDRGIQPEKVAQGISKIFAEKMQANGQVSLQPLQDIYFNQTDMSNSERQTPLPQGSVLFTRMLCGIALLILFLSTCNYLMIKMAQSQHYQEKYAIQRCFGADNKTVRLQTLQETLLVFLPAGILAVMLTIWLFPTFREIISPYYAFSFPLDASSIGLFVLIVGMVILIISHTLSQYSIHKLNAQGIKGSIHPQKSTFDLKQALMTIQVAIFCTLLACTGIISKQMNYLQTKDIGYDNRNLIAMCDQIDKSELLKNPDILSVSVGYPLPQYGNLYFRKSCLFENKQVVNAEIMGGDADYLDTYKIDLLEGENFDKNTAPKKSGTVPVIVNQEFARKAGLQHPVGTLFRPNVEEGDEEDVTYQIIGIVKDFNIYALYRPVPPVILFYSTGPNTGLCNTGELTLRYREGKRGETAEYLKEMDITAFSEYDYDRLYGKEQAFILLINICTYIAIFIGGLGIFAFSVFMTANRRKEVALRKINGAIEKDIHCLLSRQFVRITLYACIVALPLSYYFMAFWLEKFTYRTSWDWWFFLIIIASNLLFVMLVIYWQVQKTVRLNPVECLHKE